MRSRRPSSPPLMKPSSAGSPTNASTAPPCIGGDASAAIERAGGRVCRQAGFARSSFTRLFQAVFEAALQVLAVEVAADEDELAGTLLAVLPRRTPVAVHH